MTTMSLVKTRILDKARAATHRNYTENAVPSRTTEVLFWVGRAEDARKNPKCGMLVMRARSSAG